MDFNQLSLDAVSAHRLRHRIRSEGVTARGYALWQDHEDTIIAQYYPDYRKIADALPHRSYGACQARAQRIHVASTIKWWKGSDIALLRRLFPAGSKEELLSAFPDCTWRKICQAAWNHKIYRARRPYQSTGIEILDQVRSRCWELHLTMRDLDRIVRGAGYFTKRKWKGQRGTVNYKLIAKAVKALFGDLRIEWK